jgi:hypothetical protein
MVDDLDLVSLYALQDLAGSVCRAVVDNDHFFGDGYAEHPVQHTQNRVSLVVDGHDDRQLEIVGYQLESFQIRKSANVQIGRLQGVLPANHPTT